MDELDTMALPRALSAPGQAAHVAGQPGAGPRPVGAGKEDAGSRSASGVGGAGPRLPPPPGAPAPPPLGSAGGAGVSGLPACAVAVLGPCSSRGVAPHTPQAQPERLAAGTPGVRPTAGAAGGVPPPRPPTGGPPAFLGGPAGQGRPFAPRPGPPPIYGKPATETAPRCSRASLPPSWAWRVVATHGARARCLRPQLPLQHGRRWLAHGGAARPGRPGLGRAGAALA
jgi:hypothetical protein